VEWFVRGNQTVDAHVESRYHTGRNISRRATKTGEMRGARTINTQLVAIK
jgi:hypothetical protein